MYATIEEAWGVPDFSSPTRTTSPSPSLEPQQRKQTTTNNSKAAQAAQVRDYLALVYNTDGVRGLLMLLSPAMVDGLKKNDVGRGRARGRGWADFMRDPEKLLMVIAGLFVLVIVIECAKSPPPPAAFAPAPLMW